MIFDWVSIGPVQHIIGKLSNLICSAYVSKEFHEGFVWRLLTPQKVFIETSFNLFPQRNVWITWSWSQSPILLMGISEPILYNFNQPCTDIENLVIFCSLQHRVRSALVAGPLLLHHLGLGVAGAERPNHLPQLMFLRTQSFQVSTNGFHPTVWIMVTLPPCTLDWPRAYATPSTTFGNYIIHQHSRSLTTFARFRFEKQLLFYVKRLNRACVTKTWPEPIHQCGLVGSSRKSCPNLGPMAM